MSKCWCECKNTVVLQLGTHVSTVPLKVDFLWKHVIRTLLLNDFLCDWASVCHISVSHPAVEVVLATRKQVTSVRLLHRKPSSTFIPVLSLRMDLLPWATLTSASHHSHLRPQAPASYSIWPATWLNSQRTGPSQGNLFFYHKHSQTQNAVLGELMGVFLCYMGSKWKNVVFSWTSCQPRE